MDSELIARALAVRERAHAPYSRFAVGAAVRNTEGAVFAGANVENASFPEGCCAETAAIAAMVAGTPAAGQRLTAVAVVAERVGGRLTTPCGGCRQRIAEFAAPQTPIYVADPSGAGETFLVKDLLPAAFDLGSDK
jgi:cytidine deaminase